MPDSCVREVLCTMEQLKHRLIIRAGKVNESISQRCMTDEMIQQKQGRVSSIESTATRADRVVSKEPTGLNSVKEEFTRWLNDISNRPEFAGYARDKQAGRYLHLKRRFSLISSSALIQTHPQKLINEQDNNDPVDNDLEKSLVVDTLSVDCTIGCCHSTDDQKSSRSTPTNRFTNDQ